MAVTLLKHHISGWADEDTNGKYSCILCHFQTDHFAHQPGSHAFILRRYDTGAISITTLFRAAFPTASDQEERDEISWVSHHHDLTGANGGVEEDRVRFSGRWGPPSIAQLLADDYGIGHLLPPLITATPNPSTSYRGSGRASVASDRPSSPALPNKQLMTPGPPPAKRRKEDSSPVKQTPGRGGAPTPARTVTAPVPVIGDATPGTLRRSTRRSSKSPAPQRDPSPRKPLSRGMPQTLTVLSDETVVGEEYEGEDAAVDKLAQPDMNEDIAEQRALIERLKKERDAKQLSQEAIDEQESEAAAPAKRSNPEGEETLQFNFKEPETEARALVTNNRVQSRLRDLPPERKSAAWGALAFAAGLGIA